MTISLRRIQMFLLTYLLTGLSRLQPFDAEYTVCIAQVQQYRDNRDETRVYNDLLFATDSRHVSDLYVSLI